MNGFLLDTNIPSEMTRPTPSPRVESWLEETDDTKLFFSVISLAEIVRGIYRLPVSKRRSELESWLDTTLRPWFGDRVLPITPPIAERVGRIAGIRDPQGLPFSFADGLIAATALEHGLTVVTRNVRHFSSFGVSIFDPWQ